MEDKKQNRKSIDNITRLKQLQLQKMEEEVEKVRIEKERADYEFEKLKLKDKRPWYKKENFLRIGTQIFIGLAVLGFYIKFILTPIFQKESIENQLKIAKKEKELHASLSRTDSLNSITDSLNTIRLNFITRLEDREKELFVKTDSLKVLSDSIKSIFIKQKRLLAQQEREIRKENYNKVLALKNNVLSLQDTLNRVIDQKEKLALEFQQENRKIQDEIYRLEPFNLKKIETQFRINLDKINAALSVLFLHNEESDKKMLMNYIKKEFFSNNPSVEVYSKNGTKIIYSVTDYFLLLESTAKYDYNNNPFNIETEKSNINLNRWEKNNDNSYNLIGSLNIIINGSDKPLHVNTEIKLQYNSYPNRIEDFDVLIDKMIIRK